mmetsp:Transcript_12972/g.36362  ORF Transcript_12972/g.36362 Transcript_12972/m.36362 type:complete len:189 (+) Transcript_12972:846-1412(+)
MHGEREREGDSSVVDGDGGILFWGLTFCSPNLDMIAIKCLSRWSMKLMHCWTKVTDVESRPAARALGESAEPHKSVAPITARASIFAALRERRCIHAPLTPTTPRGQDKSRKEHAASLPSCASQHRPDLALSRDLVVAPGFRRLSLLNLARRRGLLDAALHPLADLSRPLTPLLPAPPLGLMRLPPKK